MYIAHGCARPKGSRLAGPRGASEGQARQRSEGSGALVLREAAATSALNSDPRAGVEGRACSCGPTDPRGSEVTLRAPGLLAWLLFANSGAVRRWLLGPRCSLGETQGSTEHPAQCAGASGQPRGRGRGSVAGGGGGPPEVELEGSAEPGRWALAQVGGLAVEESAVGEVWGERRHLCGSRQP